MITLVTNNLYDCVLLAHQAISYPYLLKFQYVFDRSVGWIRDCVLHDVIFSLYIGVMYIQTFDKCSTNSRQNLLCENGWH